MNRASGILLHVTSLPSPYGIGSLGKAAFNFINWLKAARQTYWQVLPLNPVGFGNSPYQSFGAFAGNPLLIDLDELIGEKLLTRADFDKVGFGSPYAFGSDANFVDFERVSVGKDKLLRAAFARFDTASAAFAAFLKEEADWIYDYARFMTLRKLNGDTAWTEWKTREVDTADTSEHTREQQYQQFLQYIFAKQWRRVKRYANENGIKIVGDIPIYVAYDSADVLYSPELFQLDERNRPTRVAGVPPDYFSATGQLWGNPLYNWDKMREDGYAWWLRRIGKSLELFDVLRIDHFRAFDTYWAVPYGNPTAEHGSWDVGPRMDLWNAVFAKYNNPPIIAEDLGEIFDSVRELLRDSGFHGMKIFQFGFSESGEDSEHLPHRYERNMCVYTGTHDNSTLLGWLRSADKNAAAMLKNYAHPRAFEHIVQASLRSLYSSVADTVIVPIQDVLVLDDRARMNTPGTVGGLNWRWRIREGACSLAVAKGLAELAQTYFR